MKQKDGFTLVEIAVVILIISILAAASTPMLSRAVDSLMKNHETLLLETAIAYYKNKP